MQLESSISALTERSGIASGCGRSREHAERDQGRPPLCGSSGAAGTDTGPSVEALGRQEATRSRSDGSRTSPELLEARACSIDTRCRANAQSEPGPKE